MNKNKKGFISPQDQASSLNHISALNNIRQSKKEQAFTAILLAGRSGVSELSLLNGCHVISGRNYPTELERNLNIRLGRDNIPNADGIGKHYRYWITNREDALKVAEHINRMRAQKQSQLFSINEIETLISVYPVEPEQAA